MPDKQCKDGCCHMRTYRVTATITASAGFDEDSFDSAKILEQGDREMQESGKWEVTKDIRASDARNAVNIFTLLYDHEIHDYLYIEAEQV